MLFQISFTTFCTRTAIGHLKMNQVDFDAINQTKLMIGLYKTLIFRYNPFGCETRKRQERKGDGVLKLRWSQHKSDLIMRGNIFSDSIQETFKYLKKMIMKFRKLQMSKRVRKLNCIIHTSCVELFNYNLFNIVKTLLPLTSSDVPAPLFTSSMDPFCSRPTVTRIHPDERCLRNVVIPIK